MSKRYATRDDWVWREMRVRFGVGLIHATAKNVAIVRANMDGFEK